MKICKTCSAFWPGKKCKDNLCVKIWKKTTCLGFCENYTNYATDTSRVKTNRIQNFEKPCEDCEHDDDSKIENVAECNTCVNKSNFQERE